MKRKLTRRQAYSQVALAFEMRVDQIAAIAMFGDVDRRSLRKAIDSVGDIQIPMADAAEIWGYVRGTNTLRLHYESGKLEICNPGQRPNRYRPAFVTIRQMLALMDAIGNWPQGKRG